LKNLKEEMEKEYNAAVYAREHLDQLDSVPYDTLSLALPLAKTAINRSV
jgi:hypothetical protein